MSRAKHSLASWLLSAALLFAQTFAPMPELWQLSAKAQDVSRSFTGSIYSPPNISGYTCGADNTAVIQVALTTTSIFNGVISPPPCPKTNPSFISSTILIPSNTSFLGLAAGETWFKGVNGVDLRPMFANTNFGGAASTILDSNIEIGFISVDGNGSLQNSNILNRCVYFVGVANLSMHDLEVDNCRGDAVKHDGNGASGVEPTFANKVFVNVTIGVSTDVTAGVGFTIGNRARNANVSNITTFSTASTGILIDASESNWSGLIAKASGTGSSCTTASPHQVDNPGGGAANYNWIPCPPNVYIRNVTNTTVTNVLCSQGQFHGLIVVGARHGSLSNVTCTNNSQASIGTWDDAHLDLNVFNSYGEIHDFTITGLTVGANSQAVTSPNKTLSSSPPQSRYGLSIADCLAGSVGDVAVFAGGTIYTFGNTLTLTGGTSTIAGKLTVATAPGGIVTTVNHDYTTGAGCYSVLPANPVSTSVSSGSGTLATFTVTWSTESIIGVTIGTTVTAPVRIPTFFTNWFVQSNVGNFGPRGLPVLSACGGGSPSMTTGSTDNLGQFTVGTAVASCTMTFAQPFTNTVRCLVQSESTLAAFGYTYTLSALIVTATVLGGDVVDYQCSGT